jgi:hypothetical protein
VAKLISPNEMIIKIANKEVVICGIGSEYKNISSENIKKQSDYDYLVSVKKDGAEYNIFLTNNKEME